MRGIWVIPFVSLLVCKTAACQEFVSDEPLRQDQILATLPVLGLRKLPVDKAITAGSAENGGWIFNPTTVIGSALSTDIKYTKPLNNYIYYVPSLEPNAAFDWLKLGKAEQAKAVGEAMSSWEGDYVNKTGVVLMDRKRFSSNSDTEKKEKLNKLLVTADKNGSIINIIYSQVTISTSKLLTPML
jgi:hypothetical protein